jgi:hypothetical protein
MEIRDAPTQTYQFSKKLTMKKNNKILYLEYKNDDQNLSDIQVHMENRSEFAPPHIKKQYSGAKPSVQTHVLVQDRH